MGLQIWDTAGQERFRTITTAYFRGTDAVLLGYDVTDPKSFLNVTEWVRMLQLYCVPHAFAVVLLANKIDLKRCRRVSTEQGIALAAQIAATLETHVPYVETSAKTGQGVD